MGVASTGVFRRQGIFMCREDDPERSCFNEEPRTACGPYVGNGYALAPEEMPGSRQVRDCAFEVGTDTVRIDVHVLAGIQGEPLDDLLACELLRAFAPLDHARFDLDATALADPIQI